MAFMWLSPTRPEENAVGDWYLTRDNKWVYDRNAPSPGQQPAVTQMLPVVPATEAPREFTQDDGSTYTRVSAAEFDSFDEVDSTTIVDPGAPA